MLLNQNYREGVVELFFVETGVATKHYHFLSTTLKKKQIIITLLSVQQKTLKIKGFLKLLLLFEQKQQKATKVLTQKTLFLSKNFKTLLVRNNAGHHKNIKKRKNQSKKMLTKSI